MASTKNMQYVRLGKSGLKVSKIILGCMSYGSPKWQEWVLEEEEGFEHIKFAYDHGINTFDTANVYSNGLSEIILGKAIKEFNLPRDEIVIMTKVFFPVDPTDPGNKSFTQPNPTELGFVNRHGLSRKHIFESIKASLERLQLDYVDLLQCHRFDYDTPIEETMQALHDVVKAGYARYIGMSSCHAYQFHAMQNYAINNHLTPFVSMQDHHSLVYREEEREMFPTLKMFGVGAIPWSPLARGLLTRPIQEQSTKRATTDKYLQNNFSVEGVNAEIVSRVEEIAKKKGVSMAQTAIAWSLSKDPIAAPIVGTTQPQEFGRHHRRCSNQIHGGGDQVFGGAVPAAEDHRSRVRFGLEVIWKCKVAHFCYKICLLHVDLGLSEISVGKCIVYLSS